jgi:hypothetical protein
LKNSRFIILSLIILLGVPISIAFVYGSINSVHLGPPPYYGPDISIGTTLYDETKNAIFVNCTLIEGYKGATECNLTRFTVETNRRIVLEGTPTPCKLLLNETTTVTLNLRTQLQPEIYYVNIKTSPNGGGFSLSSINVGNFVDPQQQIEIKQITYDKAANTIIVDCSRIFDRTDLSIVIKDSQSALVQLTNFNRPTRIDIDQNATQLRINPQEPLSPGKYCLYLVTEKGLITPFTVP